MIMLRSIFIITVIILLYNTKSNHHVDGAHIFHRRNFATTIFREPTASIYFTVKQSPVDLMVDLTNQLSYKLLHLHSYSNANNFAFSPCALGSVLIALYEGSYGRCSLQIHDAVQLPWDHDIIRIGYRDIHRKLRRYFYKEENLLSGLILNEEHITIRLEYENVLRFYGYDLTNGQMTNDQGNMMNNKTTTAPDVNMENIPMEMTTRIDGVDEDNDDEEISTIVPEFVSTTSTTTTKRIPTKMMTTQKPTISPIKRPTMMTTSRPAITTTTEKRITTTPITTTTTAEIATELMVDETTPTITTLKPTTIKNTTPITTTTTSTTTRRPITTTSRNTPTTFTNPPTTPRTTMYIYTFKPISNTSPIPKTTIAPNQLPITTTTILPDIDSTQPEDDTEEDDYDDTSTPSTFITTTTTTTAGPTVGSFQTQPPQRTLNPKNNLYTEIPSRIVRTKRDYNREIPVAAGAAAGDSHFIPSPALLLPPPNFVNDIFDIPLKYHHFNRENDDDESGGISSLNHDNILSLPLFPIIQRDYSIHEINDNGKFANNEFNHPEEISLGSLQPPSLPSQSSSSSSTSNLFDFNEDFNLPDIFLNQELQSKNNNNQNNRNITSSDGNDDNESDNYNMGLFHINQFEFIRVPYKFYNTILRYSELPTLKASALEIPLDSDDYSLLLLIPHQTSDLNELLMELKEPTAPTLRTIKENLHPQWIQAAIPNFKLNGNIVLTEYLMKMGIIDIFEPTRADFRIMTDQTGIYTKHVEQLININLRTHANNQLRRYANVFHRPIKISVNRPFLFFIIDTEMNLAIMSGKILNPINSRII